MPSTEKKSPRKQTKYERDQAKKLERQLKAEAERRSQRERELQRQPGFISNIMSKVNVDLDIIKDVAVWLVFTGASFLYWMFLLLMLSLFLLNTWSVKFTQIVHYSIALMVATSVFYLIRMVRKHRKA
ncbi:MAG: hypothetical protein K6G62_07905 [Eubacterium sp.]|nr:hypothetical protein [Eubacterium sp.]